MDLSPDGRFGYVPERDEDSVAKFDTESLQVVARTRFPDGSKPWMLRVSPQGTHVWVQTATTGQNVVLDARTLHREHTETLGSKPVDGAWSPDGRYQFTTQLGSDWVAVSDTESYQVIKRIRVGSPQANTSFRRDGRFAYVAVTGTDTVAVVDVDALEVATHIPTGTSPMGLILL